MSERRPVTTASLVDTRRRADLLTLAVRAGVLLPQGDHMPKKTGPLLRALLLT